MPEVHVRHRGGAAGRGFWNPTASGVFPKMFPNVFGNIVVSPGGGDISCRRREECVCVGRGGGHLNLNGRSWGGGVGMVVVD